jgi:hypothetical protein
VTAPRHTRPPLRFKDTARFELGDDAELVEASFCCQLCLRRAAHVIVGVRRDDGVAWCYCPSCQAHTEVALNAAQILRLTLAPPRGDRIHLIPEEDL